MSEKDCKITTTNTALPKNKPKDGETKLKIKPTINPKINEGKIAAKRLFFKLPDFLPPINPAIKGPKGNQNKMIDKKIIQPIPLPILLLDLFII